MPLTQSVSKNKAVIWLNPKKDFDLVIFASNIILIISKTNNLEGTPKKIQMWHQNKMIQTLPSCSLNQPIQPQIMQAIPVAEGVRSSRHCVWVARIHNMTIMVMVNEHYWFSFSYEYWSHVKQNSFFCARMKNQLWENIRGRRHHLWLNETCHFIIFYLHLIWA